MRFHKSSKITKRNKSTYGKNVSGAVAIEFAFIFPAFFLIFYAIITYGLIFAAQQTLTLAAAEGGRAALRYPGGGVADSLAARQTNACKAALLPLIWLKNMKGLGTDSGCSGGPGAPGVYVKDDPCSYANSLRCLTVTVRYAYKEHPMVPQLLGSFLSLPTPDALQGSAVVQVNTL